MKINDLHLKSDIFLRASDIWIGSEDREEVYGCIENLDEVMTQVSEILNKYKDTEFDKNSILIVLKEIMDIEVEIPWLEEDSLFSGDEINTIGENILSHYLEDNQLRSEFAKILLIDEESSVELKKLFRENRYVTFDTVLGYSAKVFDECGNRLSWISDCGSVLEVIKKLQGVIK